MNYKPRHSMADKKTPKTEEDKAGMNDLLARMSEAIYRLSRFISEIGRIAGIA